MKLLDQLASGMRGAEGGTAYIYRRGTSTNAVLYQDFEAQLDTLTWPIELDEYGRAIVYVNEIVDVVVFTEQGVALPGFTAGEQATAVEVISSKFTGTDYRTRASAVSKPTLLITVLESLQTSIENITTVVNGNASQYLVFNVKDAAYGARGDGVTDDSQAIAAAIAAAGAANDGNGGIVWFPPGTYVTTMQGVSGVTRIVGAGAGNTQILMPVDAAGPAFTVTATAYDTAQPVSIEGLRFEGGDGTEPLLQLVGSTHGARFVVRNCVFNLLKNAPGSIEVTGSETTLAYVEDCEITCGSVYGVLAYSESASPTLVMDGCRVRHTGSAMSYNSIQLSRGMIRGCIFENGTLVNPTDKSNVYIPADAEGPVLVTGCLFTDPLSAGVGCYAIHALAEDIAFVETGNVIGLTMGVHIAAGNDDTITALLGSRGYRTTTVSTTHSCDPQNFETEHLIASADITVQTPALALAPPGTPFRLIVQNTHADTALTVTLSGNFIVTSGTNTYNVGAQALEIRELVSILVDGTLGWTWANMSMGDVVPP